MTIFVPIEVILEYMNREYCSCGDDHGYFTHGEDMEDIWCKVCLEEDNLKNCNDKINWGVRRSIREIHRSKVVLKSRSVTYRYGKLYDMIDFSESEKKKRLIWK